MQLIILLYFLQAQHVSDTTMPNIRMGIVLHYTQQNTTITKHKRSQLLILTKTRYQLLQTTSHRTHTTKNHKFTLTITPPSLENETTNVVINIIVASSC